MTPAIIIATLGSIMFISGFHTVPKDCPGETNYQPIGGGYEIKCL